MPAKPAITIYPVAPLIDDRWSPRAFTNETITRSELGSLLEAARWSASCFNAQPWRLFVGHREFTPRVYDHIFSTLVEFNQTWAKPCPVLILMAAKMTFPHNGKPNPHAWHDVGMASAQLMLQAQYMGYHAHAMAGFDVDQAAELFNLPADGDIQPVSVIAVGKATDASVLPDDMAESEAAPRQRQPLVDMAFTESLAQGFGG